MEIREEIIKELLDKIEATLDATASEIAASALMSVSASSEINTAKPQDQVANLIIFNDDIYSWDRHGRVKRLSNNKWETVAIFVEGIEKVATIFGHLCVSTIKTEEQPSKIYKSSGGTTWELQQTDAEVDESAKQQAEAADAYMKDFSILFQLSGDHQKEVDEIFAKIGTSAINEVTSLLDIIKATRKYVEQTNHTAKVKHDTPGVFYMDATLHLIMEETKELLSRIDATVDVTVDASTKTLKDAGII